VNRLVPSKAVRVTLGLALAQVLWALQHALSSLFAVVLCRSMGSVEVRRVLVIIGCACLVGCVAGGVTAWRTSMAHRPKTDDVDVFLSFAGIAVSASFALGVVWNTFGPSMVRACEVLR
jgi:hypothetical protein